MPRPQRPRRILARVLATLVAGAPVAAIAAPYDFVVLAATGGPATPSSSAPPSIGDDGTVAFLGSTEGVTRLLAVRDPGATALDDYTVIARPGSAGLRSWKIGTVIDGRVAFAATRISPDTARMVMRGDGGPLETLFEGEEADDAAPAVNGAGELALIREAPDRVVVVSSGLETVLFEHGQELLDGSVIDRIDRPHPDIDGTGRVAFTGTLDSAPGLTCADRIWLSGPADPILVDWGQSLDPACSFNGLDPVVPLASNDQGSVAYVGTFYAPAESDSFVDAVFADGAVVWDERVEGFPPFEFILDVAINDLGTVAFLHRSAPSSQALYLGPDPVADKVIATGDALCGATVLGLSFHRYGLNDADEIALLAQLSDARSVVLRAEPTSGPGGACITEPVPEPGAALAALAACAALGSVRRRRVSR